MKAGSSSAPIQGEATDHSALRIELLFWRLHFKNYRDVHLDLPIFSSQKKNIVKWGKERITVTKIVSKKIPKYIYKIFAGLSSPRKY